MCSNPYLSRTYRTSETKDCHRLVTVSSWRSRVLCKKVAIWADASNFPIVLTLWLCTRFSPQRWQNMPFQTPFEKPATTLLKSSVEWGEKKRGGFQVFVGRRPLGGSFRFLCDCYFLRWMLCWFALRRWRSRWICLIRYYSGLLILLLVLSIKRESEQQKRLTMHHTK